MALSRGFRGLTFYAQRMECQTSRRAERLTFRVAPSERHALEAAAENAQLTLSELIRVVVFRAGLGISVPVNESPPPAPTSDGRMTRGRGNDSRGRSSV